MKPFKNKLVIIKKCDELKHRFLIAIDVGNAFTKVLFLNRRNKDQLLKDEETFLNLELSSFHTKDFECALKWIRENAYLPEDKNYNIHITGSFAFQHQETIKSILETNVFYIDEYMTTAVGCIFALEYIGVENLLARPVEYESYGIMDNEMLNRIWDGMKKQLTKSNPSTNGMHPCLFHVQGSGSLCYYFDGKGSCEYFGATNVGRETFLGLSKCLFNCNDYNEILDIASTGNRCNVDTQVKDVMEESTDSPYGNVPLEMPVFPFGKSMDSNQGVEFLRKEDLANSLVSYHIHNIIAACSPVCLAMKISKTCCLSIQWLLDILGQFEVLLSVLLLCLHQSCRAAITLRKLLLTTLRQASVGQLAALILQYNYLIPQTGLNEQNLTEPTLFRSVLERLNLDFLA